MSNQSVVFQWDKLLPKISVFFDGKPQLDDLSSGIIWLLIFSLVISICWVLNRFMKSRTSVKHLISILDGVTAGELSRIRRDILREANQRPDVGALWSEFDETLVESVDGKSLFNTVDASYFFNTHTLAKGITENRFIAAIPSFFTAIGVLGTFLGLSFGLGQVDFDSLQDLDKSIKPLIAGAALAFTTSVWGVGCSLVFNFFEKFFEQRIRRRIHELQNKIDQLFPRNLSEKTLVEIEHYSKESEETLKGLAEQIGVRLQRAVFDMTEKVQVGIQEGIQQSILPAVEQMTKAAVNLADRQGSGAQESFEKLINEFSDSVSTLGREHQRSLQDVSQQVHSGVESLGTSLQDFAKEMQSQLQEARFQDEKRKEHFENLLQTMNANWQTSTQSFLEKISDSVDLLEKRDEANNRRLDEQVTQMQTAWGEKLSLFLEKVDQQINGWQSNADTLSLSISDQLAAGRNMIEQSKVIAEKTELSSSKIEVVSDNLVTAAGMLEDASSNISSLGSLFKEATDSARNEYTTAIQKINEASHLNTKVAEGFEKACHGLNAVKEDLAITAENLSGAANTAKAGFENLSTSQKNFLEGLGNNLEALQTQVAELLDDYSKRVQAQTVTRLEDWNKNTQEFCDAMKDAVSAINDIVNDLYKTISTKKNS